MNWWPLPRVSLFLEVGGFSSPWRNLSWSWDTSILSVGWLLLPLNAESLFFLHLPYFQLVSVNQEVMVWNCLLRPLFQSCYCLVSVLELGFRAWVSHREFSLAWDFPTGRSTAHSSLLLELKLTLNKSSWGSVVILVRWGNSAVVLFYV